jgi:hypothetical protein
MARRLEPGELLTRPSPWLGVAYGVGGAAVVIGGSVTSFHRSAPLAAYFAVVAFTAFTAWSLVMVATGFYISFFARVVGALLFPVASLERSRGIEMGPSWLWQLLGAGVFFGLLYAGRAGRQQARDEAASALVEQLRSGISRDDIPPFCLYLRPFEITNRLPTTVSDAGPGEKGEAVDFESLLADSLAPQYTLVALGQPGEIYGAGRRLTSEYTWRDEFRRLAAAADFILLLPSANPGTFEEITWLAEHGLIDRCVWLMPAAVEPDALANTRQRERLESSWERARSACAKLGLKLPPYDARGFLVRIGPDGKVLAMEPSAPGFWATAGLRRSLYRLWQV